LDGGRTTPQSVASSWNNKLNGIKLDSKKEYIHIRKLEVKNMGGSGIAVQGSYSIVEGCKVHHNFSAGVAIYGGEWHEDRPNYVIPYKRGYNIIRDNEIYANSDVGLHGSSGDGGNADGIWVGSGKFNKIEHNRVYKNSDDGIDTWRSNDTYVAYNIVFENGLAEGDGNGIKAGGNLNKDAKNGRRAIVEHNIVYNNRAVGVDYNAGRFDIFRYNTAYHNGSIGYRVSDNTKVSDNIAYENGRAMKSSVGDNNSWNRGIDIDFISTDPKSNDFLKTKNQIMGAYAGIK
jgi:parallel beta-helix repeat protein